MIPLPGDVVLYPVTPRSPLGSRLVAIGELLFGTGRRETGYSHAAILAEDLRFTYEAKWPKIGRYPIDQSRPYEVWSADGILQSQRDSILMSARKQCGQWYDVGALVTFGLINHKNMAVCSELVGSCYKWAGIRIPIDRGLLLSPNAIADFDRMRLVCRNIPGKGWEVVP